MCERGYRGAIISSRVILAVCRSIIITWRRLNRSVSGSLPSSNELALIVPTNGAMLIPPFSSNPRSAFNLINRVDYDATLARLTAYEQANRSSSSRHAAQSESDSQALAALESQLAQLRKARMEKRKLHEVEDLKWRRDEEDEVVRAIEDGREEEVIEAVQARWKRKREEREREREAEEEEGLQREEEVRRGLEGAKNGTRPPPTAGGGDAKNGTQTGNGATASSSSSASGWSAHSLQTFTGPLATLSTGLEHFIDPTTKQDLTLIAPSRLLLQGSSSSSSGGAPPPTASTTTTLTPYDPWTQPVLEKLSAEDVEALKAGGFDWCENWRWDLSVAVGSLAVRPPPAESHAAGAAGIGL